MFQVLDEKTWSCHDCAGLSLQQQEVEGENVSPIIQTKTDGGCVKTKALRVGVDSMMWVGPGGGGVWKKLSQTIKQKLRQDYSYSACILFLKHAS